MATVTVNENITAIVSERTLAELERDSMYWDLYSCYQDELDMFLDYNEPMSDYPDWFASYHPIEVFR